MNEKLKKALGFQFKDFPKPPLEDGEQITLEDRIVYWKGRLSWRRPGRLIVTNRRLFFDETVNTWPFKRTSFQLPLSEIASVDKGTVINFLFGGRPMRLRLRNGKDVCFWDDAEALEQWIDGIKAAVRERQFRP